MAKLASRVLTLGTVEEIERVLLETFGHLDTPSEVKAR
jgi:hypothetical protein